MRRVVITGLGTVNPLGKSVEESWANVQKNVCGISEITQFDTTGKNVNLAGSIKDLDINEYIDKKESKRMDRFVQLAVIAGKEAVADAKIDLNQIDPNRIGVLVASGIGGLSTIETEHYRGIERGFERVSPFFIPMSISNMAAGAIAIEHGFKGMCSCVVTACAAGTNAIGDAYRHIKDGYAEVMVTGGSESCITELGIGGFASLKALSTSKDPNRASIPFDKERNGFVMGEGAGILILEEYEHAKKRNAKIYGEIGGYATNCDAYHVTAPSPDGETAALCMINAVKDAGYEIEDVDYINAHGTSTSLNDSGETRAVKIAFKEHAYKLMMSSTKSMTGHLLGGTGAVEAIFTILAIRDSFVPATINYKVPDENCDLDIVPNQGRKAQINVALSNSLGFGGHNACILLKKFD